MKKKILLLFSLVILCIPLLTHAQNYNQNYSGTFNAGENYNQEVISTEFVTANVNLVSIVTDNGTLDLTSGSTFNKSDLTTNIKVNWTAAVNVRKYGFSAIIYPGFTVVPLGNQINLISGKKATITFFGIDTNGVTKYTLPKTASVSGTTITFTADELTSLKKYNNIKIDVTLVDAFQAAETNFPVRLVQMPFTYTLATAPDHSQYINYLSFNYMDNYSPTPTIFNTTSNSLTFLGEPDTKVSGLSEVGGSSHDHALDISQSGTGVVIFNQCNLSSLLVSLINVDFGCQTVTSMVLQDASGNVKKTFTSADYATVGSNQIQLSLSNVNGISDNDKLQIALTNSCTTNHESDYTIILSTEGKETNGTTYANKELFPSNVKVPIAISQKGGTNWCDNSSAFFFNVSGANGYTNINFSNTTPDGASFSVAKGQAAILGTANFYKCLTGVNIPVPSTKMPKTPVIADLEYCNGTNFNFPIKNPSSDYTTETFRLLLDGTEKVGWQGTKSFNGINLGKVGTASAVVESTNGECFISSSPATIASRIQPIALAFNGSLSYYTEQVNTTIVQTTQQDGVTYKIFKDGSGSPQDTWIGIKAQTLTKGSYRITAENANASCSAETNLVIVEKDLNIGSAWVTTDLSFCQLEGTKDLNSFVSFNGASSVVFTSTAGLSITGSNVDLASSTAGTYVITCTAIKDGVTKVFTKNFTVKPKANDITLSLVNSTDFSCNTDNPQLQVTTDYPGYNYTWYKGATIVDGTARTNTIALTKAEGSQNFTAVATATNGCLSSPSPAQVLIKNNLTADVNFTSGTQTFCQSIAGTANVFDDLTGADKISVSQEQGGFTYTLSSSSTDLILVNRNKIDLERSKAGTYTITMAYSQNGCTKSITKQYVIKQMPSVVTITLENASTLECDMNNVNANLRASYNAYSYNWYKKGSLLTDNTQTISVPVSKADGVTNLYAFPVLDGCLGIKTNEVSVTKRYVEANVSFSSSVTEYCQKTGGSIDIFTELSGTDKIAVVNSQSGYTWTLTPSGSGLKVTGSTINLETSQAGTYTLTMVISKDGCTKTITKDVTIRQRPADFTIALTNSTDFACNNSTASMAASVSSYTYNWFKNGVNVGTGTTISIPVTKADVSNASRTIYAIGTAVNTCETNPSTSVIAPLKTFLEADLSMGSGTSTYCQSTSVAKTDIFDLLSGADKVAITTNQHYTWSITAPGLIMASTHEIDLQQSTSGTYTVSFTYTNDGGCSKTLTRMVIIKPKPNNVSITLQNAETIECDMSNVDALLKADNAGYTYRWIKKGVTQTDNTQTISIPVSKADGRTFIYALPMLDGCFGPQTNIISVTKRYVEANVAFTNTVTEYCQKTGGSVDIFTELTGTDKIAVVNSQSGYTWTLTPSGTGLKVTGSTINLETSQAGTYTLTMVISKDDCSKTITKDVVIRQRPADFTIALTNSTDFSCNNSAASMAASVTSYTYNWFKNGVNVGTGTTISIPVTKADVSDASRTMYAIGTAVNTCETNPSTSVIAPLKTFLEADISISSGTATFCQSPVTGKTDIFDFLSGTDKLAVTTNQHYTWSITAPGLILASTHEIDLFNSPAGTYIVSFNYINDGGCAKTLTKTVVINPRPNSVAITLTNASTVECDLSNPNALVQADNSGYTYNWYKKGTLLSGNTQAISVPVSKIDGLTGIYGVPFLGTCIGLQSNTVSLIKRYVEADFGLIDGLSENCQTVGSILDTRSLVTGADKDKLFNEQDAYTWDMKYSTSGLLFTDAKSSIINLEKSFAQTYTSSLNIHRDGCTKTFTKDIKIKPRPIPVDITLQNANNLTCNTADAQFKAAVSIYTYQWSKNSTLLSETSQNLTLPIAKADGLVSVSAIPVLDGCVGVKTNVISTQKFFVEADLTFSTGVASYCQYPGTKLDLFTELSGTDKVAVQQKQNGYTWSFTGSTVDLVIVGSEINLETSKTGTYTVTMTISKDGCTKALTKSIIVKAQPVTVAIVLQNASTLECDLTNPNALVKAENSAYTYNWYKKGTLLTDNTQSVSIPVSKSDAATSIYAVPVLDGCIGLKSNEVSVTKRYVEADLTFSANAASYCQYPGTKLDLFTELSGTDKVAIQQKQNGYTWSFTGSTTDLVIVGSEINLETSASGTYTVSMVITKDGCSKTLTKSVVIKAMPSNVAVTLDNASTIECDLKNPDALVYADNSAYTYNWSKNGTPITGTTQSMSIPVSKTDGLTSILAVPVLNGCVGLQSNAVSLTKRYVVADVTFNSTDISYCQKDNGTVDLFAAHLIGADKDAVQGKKNGFDWSFAAPSSLVINNGVIDLQKSASGVYDLSLVISNNGCTKTLTKSVVIKEQPGDIAIALTNNTDYSCNVDAAQLQASVTSNIYAWYKNGTLISSTGSNTAQITIPVSKADGTTNFYAVGQSGNSCASRTSNVITVVKHFVEADLAFSTGVASYCQYPKTTVDLFTEVSGTDKLAIQGKQNGWGWSFTGSTADLVIVGSEINLETSAAGTYTVSMVITKDGCSKTLTKSVVIKAMPSNVAVTLDNASTIECDQANPNAQVHADNSAYTYNWSKNGVAVTGNTQVMSIPVSKADGLTSISAVSVLNGCVGLQSNTVSLTKRFVEADFGFNNTPITLASKDETVNLFDYTVGKDKDAIINQTGGFTYKIAFIAVKQTAISSIDGSVVPASGLQSGDTQYSLDVVVSKNGCDLTYSKTATIKSIPRNITIDFASAQSTQECTSNNYMNVVASDSTAIYKWYKNDVLIAGQSKFKASIEVFKTDGTVKIYAIPSTKDGFDGYKTNILNTTKRYVTADLQLDQTTETLCSVAGKKINVFDYVRGNDKAAVMASQYGYTYNTGGDCGTAIATNQYVDVDNSLADDNATKTVSLTVSQNGCSVIQNKTFIIKRKPADITIELLSKASNTSNKNLFCGGDTLSLHVSTSNSSDVSYKWFKDGALIGTTTTPTFVYPFSDASGTINLSATSVYNSNSCPSTVSNVITVQKKDVNFNIAMASDAIAYCPEAKKINLFDYVSGDDKTDVMNQNNDCSYVFTASGNNGLAISSYSFLDLDNSNYSTTPYSLTFDVNKQGCVKSFTRQISIKPRPVTPLVALTSNSELRYCGGDVVTLTDKNAQTGTYYKWTVNGTDVAASSSILKYTTDQASEIGVQAISYFNSNSCPSKASDVLRVSNVVPRVDIKLINTTVTVNDLIQFYVFESTASKSIKLTATRVSDKTVTDLPYTREGNVITLSGILPIGEYSFSAIAENALTGYCSQNIVITNTLTVTNSTREGTTNSGAILVSSSDEIAMKTIYDEYMAQLKKGEVHSILLPILTASYEPAKLSVFTTDDNESVIIRVVDIQGHVISSRTEFLLKGENDFTIKGDDKPVIPGMYLINIDYSIAHKSETLKGLVK